MAEETCCVVLVTASSQQEGEAIAQSLVETRLAACVTLLPVQSIYRWQGEICKAEEWQLLIKSDRSRFAALEAKVKELHSYEVPEIVAVSIVAGSANYLQWIAEQVNGDS